MVGMKDSGIEWIGEIPEEWGTAKLGPRVYMKGRIGWQGLRFDDFVDEGPYLVTGTDFCDGKVDWSCCYHINGEKYAQDPAIHLRNGDLLFTKDGTVGKLAYIDELPGPASLNSHLLVLRPKDGDVDNRYLFWLLQSSVFDRYKLLVQHGSVMDSISQTDMAHFIIPAPTANEQAAIADYLDSSIDENDAAARAVETQISALERYRASVIHEAVTRGLDPTAPTKPSNVDWIGNIPQGWEMTKLKYETSICNGLDYSAEDICDPGDAAAVLVVRSSNISNGKMVHADDVYVSSSVPASCRLKHDDLVIVRANGSAALVGKSALFTLNETAAAGGFMLICRSCSNRYLRWLLQSDLLSFYRSQFETTTIGRISSTLLGNMLVPWPGEKEREAIADYLGDRTAAIDAVIDTKRKQLDVLKRRRQSLIYEYVTGKRRVSEEA